MRKTGICERRFRSRKIREGGRFAAAPPGFRAAGPC